MSEIGYTPKNLLFEEEGRDKLYRGIKTIAKAVKSTLGPSGQTVLIESPQHTHGITVTKDGVTVAKSVSLLDPTENLAVRIMKEAADRTAQQAGDGTTTAIVITEALVNAGRDLDENKTQVLRDLVTETNCIIDRLKKKARKVNNKTLKDVATISANNDSDLGDIIAKVYKRVGRDGVVAVDKSQSSKTYYESTNGLKIDRGFASPLFINDQKKDECILEDCYVLVSDATIENILQIENVLKSVINTGKRLLIIAPTSPNVINTLAANVMKNGLKICVIPPPNFGYKQHELMQDIAVSINATYFSEKTGDDLSLMTEEDLGHCAKVIVGRDSTVIIKEDEPNKDAIKERVAQLRVAIENTKLKADKEFILSRIASLTGGVGVIYVGGNTDLEQKELYDRVDDAVCAVRSALEEGILPGGGLALFREALDFSDGDLNSKKHIQMLYDALQAPLLQIWENAGEKYENGVFKDTDIFSGGYDVKNDKFGCMYDMGIIDPLKVTKCALQNAVSVAVTLLSTNAIITMARTYEDKN
tara:strand:- start:850 stop:2442 length:1593 start_codon:yes stop_codon:yes gene_type:complete